MATIDILINAKNNASAAIDDVNQALNKLDKNANGVDKAFGNLQKTITVGVVGAMAAVGTAIAGAGVAMVKGVRQAADLEQQLANIASVTGSTMEQMQPFKDLITDLAVDPNLKVTTTEAADAIEMLARNGLSMDEILQGATKSTVLLANATGAEFGMAADIATDVMALFNINASEMSSAVNGITSVVTGSKFSIEDYAFAIAQGGGVAASVGVDFQDFNTTIAAIAPFFSSGSDAGTSFKTMLQRLVPASGPAEKAMQDLGIITADGVNQFFSATGELRSMSEISGVLQNALSGLSEEQKNNAVSTIFGTDAMRAAFALAEIGEGQFRQLAESMSLTDAVEASSTRMDTFAGTMEILGGIVESIQIQIGSAFMPILRRLAVILISLAEKHGPAVVSAFESFADILGMLFDYIENVREEGRLLTLHIDSLPKSINMAIRRFLEFQNTLSNFVRPIIESISRFVTLQDVLGAVGIVIASILIPALGSIVMAAAPVILLFGALVLAVSRMRALWDTNFNGIRDVVQRVIDVISSKFGGLIDGSTSLSDAISDAFGAILTYVTDNLPSWITKLGEWGSALVSWISDNIEPAKTKLSEWYRALSGWLTANLPAWIATLSGWGSAIWGFIVSAIEPTKTKLGEWYNAAVDWLGENLPDWTIALLQWSTELVDWIGDAVPKAIDALGNFVLEIIGYGNSDIVPELEKQGEGFGTALINWVNTVLIPKVAPEFEKFKTELTETIDKIVEEITETAAKLGPPLYEWLTVDALPKVIEGMTTLRTTVIGDLRTMDEEGNIYAGALANHMERISGAIETLGTWINSLIRWWQGLNPDTQQAVVEFGLLAGTLRVVWPLVQTLSNWLGVTGLLGVIGRVVAAIAGAAGSSALIPVLTALSSPLGLAATAVAALALTWTTNFLNIRDHTLAMVNAISTGWGNLTTNLATWWRNAHATIGQTLSTSSASISQNWTTFTTNLSNGWRTLTENLSTWWSNTLTGFRTTIQNTSLASAGESFIQTLWANWSTFTEGLASKVGDVRENIKAAFQGLIARNEALQWQGRAFISSLWAWWGDSTSISGISAAVISVRENIKTQFRNLQSRSDALEWQGRAFISSLWAWWGDSTSTSGISAAVVGIRERIKTELNNLQRGGVALQWQGRQFIASLWEWWGDSTSINRISAAAISIRENIKTQLRNLQAGGAALQWQGREFIASLWAWWGDRISLDRINAAIIGVRTAITSALGDLWSVGRNLIESLINGLSNRWQQLISPGQSAWQVFQAILQWIRDQFRIGSPSKVMEDMGGNLTDGLALGIVNGLPDVINAAQLMANSVMGVASGMTLSPNMAMSASTIAAQRMSGNIIQPSNVTNSATYNLNYQTMQSAGSVQQDIELLNLLYGGQL